MEFVLLQIPHIIPAFVAMGFLGRFAAVMADQPPAEFSDAQIEEWRRVRIERARSRRVRAGVGVHRPSLRGDPERR